MEFSSPLWYGNKVNPLDAFHLRGLSSGGLSITEGKLMPRSSRVTLIVGPWKVWARDYLTPSPLPVVIAAISYDTCIAEFEDGITTDSFKICFSKSLASLRMYDITPSCFFFVFLFFYFRLLFHFESIPVKPHPRLRTRRFRNTCA